MALFDKPFRYVPTDPADISSRADVAVADPVATDAPATGTGSVTGTGEGSALPGDPADKAVPAAATTAITIDPVEKAIEPPSMPVEPPAKAIESPDKPIDAAAKPIPSAVTVADAVVPSVAVEGPAEPAAIEAATMPIAPAGASVAAASVHAPHVMPHRNAPVVELVRRDEHEIRPHDAGGLIVFSRVVPPTPASPPLETQRLVTAIAESEPVLDQLRSLAASLHQARAGRELRVIAVTSSVSGEGKTLLAANLALTLSRSYMRQVLLIDADLRRPGLHRLFGTSSRDGIHSAMEAVREGAPVAVQEVAPRLALLPAGKPVRDPISVLASDAMQRLMASANAAFDWVIVDTPPVGMLPDMSLLGSLSDAVLLVVEAGRVRYDLVQRTVETIGADRIFGVVLNKVPEQDIVASYGMHYYAPYR